KPHHLGRANGNVRVARKIAVNLKAEKERGQEHGSAIVVFHIVIDAVYVQSEAVSHHQLHKIPPQHYLKPLYNPMMLKMMDLIKLGQKVFCPLYGAGYQLRKKRNKNGVDPEMFFGF